jgi:hypothetical protein
MKAVELHSSSNNKIEQMLLTGERYLSNCFCVGISWESPGVVPTILLFFFIPIGYLT